MNNQDTVFTMEDAKNMIGRTVWYLREQENGKCSLTRHTVNEVGVYGFFIDSFPEQGACEVDVYVKWDKVGRNAFFDLKEAVELIDAECDRLHELTFVVGKEEGFE